MERHRKPSAKTILCVDDEVLIRDLCVNALEEYRVLTADCAESALEVLAGEDAVDIVLTDVMMPGLSGLELLQQIKEQQPDLAVILMTGYSDKDLILEALKAGADDFINKPINLLQLSTTVEKVLDKQRIRQELSNLKQLDKLKSDFLGLISHKLKTPATAISLFIQNIADGIESPRDENFRQMLAMVQSETVHLEQLIQDLLYFSEAALQDQELDLEPLNLTEIADQVATALKPAAISRHIDYRVDMSPAETDRRIMLNRQRISFAVRALLDNAIKFTPEGGRVSMCVEERDARLQLHIDDTGIGIQQQELSKVFNKFYQVDPENTGQIRGFGLGLYYARDFIRSMGGQLTLSSTPEQGTRATISFPFVAAPRPT